MKLEFINASKLDMVSGPQTVRPKGKGLSIPKSQVDGLSNPLSITMGARHTIHIPKKIDSNPTRRVG